ncbi:hypothetical protein [Limosilactobacillus reuteri]|uniref:hypothetical protein n=1 Tax=Limosilactobacillus reuteri TaxID=1598 RepID=UPI003F27A0D5
MDQTQTKKYTLKDLANEFGVSKPTVVNILAKNEIGEIEKKGNRKIYGQNAFDAIAKHQNWKDNAKMIANDASKKMSNVVADKKYDENWVRGFDAMRDIKNSLDHLIELSEKSGSSNNTDALSKELILQISDRLSEEGLTIEKIITISNQVKILVNSVDLIIKNQNELMTKIDNLNEKVDGLYSKLVKNIHHVNYQKVGNVVADVLEKRQEKNKNAKLHIAN